MKRSHIFILIGIILIIFCALVFVWSRDVIVWEHYTSSKMNVAFEYPQGWEILYDSPEIKSDVFLCPPESERIAARYLYLNCITFLFGSRLHSQFSEMEGDNAVFMEFKSDMATNTDKVYDQYRIMRHKKPDDTSINLTALFRDGSTDQIGMWQLMCHKGEYDQCIYIFEHVLNSLVFLTKSGMD